ncbi:type II toxin-antitoxin system Phd/YefM family antitoxin [Vibrio sp. ZF 223]|uniref:type II toxin-antitoxin system Phd/YefM family antitoxin n=1 Tax=Vibrio sp. ZF 223 TaxID=2056191 RepID=UPI000D37EB0A|nr:type II toxin-antitoxin system prevent-host-death family antitoxin [Vibrio sp. ZF 223]PTQ06504.1 type II toxin-antitoxin system prevent-host-death family antitoxin [Vibrio sp. ZF 223]
MNIVSFTEARNSLKSVLDRVVDDSDVTVITRRDSEDAVVMSLDHFNSMQETLYLMSSPKNAERLAESIAQLETENTTVRELNNDE